jgi:serine/threonine protein kinase
MTAADAAGGTELPPGGGGAAIEFWVVPTTTSDLPRPFGPYELVRLLAASAVVDVFLAQARASSGFQKAVAVKVVRRDHLDDDPDFVRQLVEEADIASRLRHKNIVQVIELGEVDRQPFVAMEYVDGIDLATLLGRLGRQRAVAPRVAAYVVRELCEGLDHAHRQTDDAGRPLRVVHRAVSPSNILLSNTGDVKLNDFGIAKAALRAAATQAGQIKGKYGYMAPEQARGEAVDARADVFAAGVVLYELVTGRSAYPDLPLPALLERLTRGAIEPAEKLVADLHPVLANILRRATAADLAQRHPSARALADDLRVFLRMLGGSPEIELAQFIERISDTARSQLAPLLDDMSHEVTPLEPEVKYGKTTATPAAAARKVPAGIGSQHPTVDATTTGPPTTRMPRVPGRLQPTAPPPPLVVPVASPAPATVEGPPPGAEPGPRPVVLARPPSVLRAVSLPGPLVRPPSALRAPSLPGPQRRRVPAADDHPTEVMDVVGPDAALLAAAASIQSPPSRPPPRNATPETPAAEAETPASPAPAAKAETPETPAPAAKAETLASPAPAAKAETPETPAPAAKAETPASPAPAAKAETPETPAPAAKPETPETPAGATPDVPADAPPMSDEPRVVVTARPPREVTARHHRIRPRSAAEARRPILLAVGIGALIGVTGALALAIVLAR